MHGEPRYFAVEGLNAHGQVLGRSAAVPRPPNVAVYGEDAFVSASRGNGTLPVACFTLHAKRCAVTATIKAGGTVLNQTSRLSLPAGTSGLLTFVLTSAGRSMLASAHHHRLAVQVTAKETSGDSANRHLELVQYTTTGAGPSLTTSPAPTIQLLGSTDFATENGAGSIVSVCYAAIRCYVHGSLSAAGKQIATIAGRSLGANEVGYLPFQLTPAGKAKLARAAGNQLAVQVTLSNGSDVATGQIALVRYS